MACNVDDPTPAGPGTKLTNAEVEPVGAHCAAGGVAVHTGFDANGNGMIDAGEQYSTTYVCSHKTLLREDVVSSGAVCPGGGVLVRSGHDANDNGSLEDPEIEDTATVCHSDEIYRGDLKASDFASATSREHLSHMRIVTGNVLVDGNASMPGLELVGGNLHLAVNDVVELPALARIAGNLTGPPTVLLNNPGTGRAVKFKAPSLATIGGKVSLTSWQDDGIFATPSLAAVDGDMLVAGKITTVELGKLATVGGNLDLDVQPQALSLPAISRVGGKVIVSGWFTGLDMPALETTAGFDLVYSSIASLKLPALKTASTIRIGQSAKLESVEMPLVSGVTSLQMYDAPLLAAFDAPGMIALDKLTLTRMSMPDMAMFSNLRTIKALSLAADTELVDLGGLDLLTTATSLAISNNTKLASLEGLDHVTTVTGDITIKNNPALASLAGLATLTNVGGHLAISDNAALPQSEVDAFLHRLGR